MSVGGEVLAFAGITALNRRLANRRLHQKLSEISRFKVTGRLTGSDLLTLLDPRGSELVLILVRLAALDNLRV